MQVADVKKVLMSTHKMNETGLRVVLDGVESYFIEKHSGKSTPIKYEQGRYYFDIWVPSSIKKNDARKKHINDDMQTDTINPIISYNNCWVLGTDDSYF